MDNRPTPKTRLFSSTCKRCQNFITKTEAKKRKHVANKMAFGCCTPNPCQETLIIDLIDRPIDSKYIPCRYYKFKPCSGIGNTYAVLNTATMSISYITPMAIEAKIMVKRLNDPNTVAIEIRKIK